MRVKTRSGDIVSLPNGSAKKQEKFITKTETYYVVHLKDGRRLHLTKPVPSVKVTVIDLRK